MAKTNKTFIIAEIGINHNGNLDEAKRLIEVASKAKVNAVKFQAWAKGRFLDIENLRLTKDQLIDLQDYVWNEGLEFMCTAFDFESIDFLHDKLKLERWKVPSGMVTNIRYLEKIKSINPKHIILSTGMCDIEEINKALWTLHNPNRMYRNILLHCVTVYPAEPIEVNLRCMETLQSKFYLPVGLSDHTGLVEIPIAAVAMGAPMIEVHVTMDKDQEGPDHKASYEWNELFTLVNMIRNVELAMGDGIKRPVPREMEVRDKIREKMKCSGAKTV